VAWVAERKNVLSTCFWLLTTFVYALYAERPGLPRYAVLISVFTLGLMAKPMLVTLPFTLLLLDFWPLRRMPFAWGEGNTPRIPLATAKAPRLRELIMEKIPLLFLSLLAAYLAKSSLRFSDTEVPFEAISLSLRLQNAIVSYVTYLAKVIWPSHLAMFYPFPPSIPWETTLLSVLVLCGITICAVIAVRGRPYLLVCWLWFLGTVVPVSGIIQAGLWPALADRWAYIPSIGLFVAIIWSVSDLIERRLPNRAGYAAVMAGLVIAGLTYAGHRQAAVWENDIILYQNAVEKVERNYLAHNNLGAALYAAGREEEALSHLHESKRINPWYSFPYYNIGLFAFNQKQYDEAETLFAKAVDLNPQFGVAHMYLADTMMNTENLAKAFHHYQIALKSGVNDKKIHNQLGIILLKIGKIEGAIRSFHEALQLDPEFPEACNNLGFTYLKIGKIGNSIRYIEKSLAINPDNPMTLENLQDAIISLDFG
jgi:Tfp pilus assembly protein PilF